MVEVAAVALLLGIDPVVYAERRGIDRAWTDAVVARAWRLRIEEAQAGLAARII